MPAGVGVGTSAWVEQRDRHRGERVLVEASATIQVCHARDRLPAALAYAVTSLPLTAHSGAITSYCNRREGKPKLSASWGRVAYDFCVPPTTASR
jgi:hypothetical protein